MTYEKENTDSEGRRNLLAEWIALQAKLAQGAIEYTGNLMRSSIILADGAVGLKGVAEQTDNPVLQTPEAMAFEVVTNIKKHLIDARKPRPVTAEFSLVQHDPKKESSSTNADAEVSNIQVKAHDVFAKLLFRLPGLMTEKASDLNVYNPENLKQPDRIFEFRHGEMQRVTRLYHLSDDERAQQEEQRTRLEEAREAIIEAKKKDPNDTRPVPPPPPLVLPNGYPHHVSYLFRPHGSDDRIYVPKPAESGTYLTTAGPQAD